MERDREMQILRDNMSKREEGFLREIRAREQELEEFKQYKHRPLEAKIKELHDENLIYLNKGQGASVQLKRQHEQEIMKLQLQIIAQAKEIERLQGGSQQSMHLPQVNLSYKLCFWLESGYIKI